MIKVLTSLVVVSALTMPSAAASPAPISYAPITKPSSLDASAAAPPRIIKPRGCQTRIDEDGPGGAQRLHAKCGRKRVHVRVACPNSPDTNRMNYSSPRWRKGSNKATCQKEGWIDWALVKAK
ncbi:hypothetical protein SMC26_29575 [Actinomadura fulvescens]